MASSNPQIRMFHHQLPFLFLCVLFYCSIDLSGGTPQRIKCFEDERQALLQFKQGITLSPTGECGFLTSWGENGDCCQWRGIRCNNITNHFTMLNLAGCHLQGNVSPSLSELKCLRHLDLSSNDFDEQPIPGFIGSLVNLEHLNLSQCSFIGEIPYQLGNLTKLETLDLSMYSYPKLYVKSLEWLTHLSSLRYLDLSDAGLSEATNWMQIVSNLPSLSDLRMKYCNLPAKIPPPLTSTNSSAALHSISLSSNYFNDNSLFEWLLSLPGITTRLVHLDLSWNELGGTIPEAFQHMQHLSHLDLSYNNLRKPVSSKLKWSMPSLSYLDLSGNNFHAEFSDIFSDLCNLETLKLGNMFDERTNNFTDDFSDLIETVLGCADQVLVSLDLSQNSFSGSISDTIGSFSSLRELYLAGNQLNGNISRAIGRLIKLEKLYISYNSLQGTLTSEHFLGLSNLQEFSSRNNHGLVVNISGNWFPPFQLNMLDLRGCNFGPGFPKWLRTQNHLLYIDISNAQISDNVPASFWNSLSANLKYLNLSNNQIFGVIPNLLVNNVDNLNTVDLSSNLFEGALPSWFTDTSSLHLNDNRFSDFTSFSCHKTKSSLSLLHLSNNLLSGELPDCWMNFDQLTSLHLTSNQLHGSIPKSIGSLIKLESLQLHNNSLSGHLPESLENCRSLIILDLGYNLFTGYIPPWIGYASPNLGILFLQRNKFSGEIPLSLCQLSYLQILDLSANNISGKIPKCIRNLTAMGEYGESTLHSLPWVEFGNPFSFMHQETYIKRERRRFKEFVYAPFKSIDLSSNELHGEIPDGISSLTGLVSLNLSVNRLGGRIASDIDNLKALEVLDFSDNHLSGEIPSSLTKLSYLVILGLSNNNLSEEIPRSLLLQGFDASSYTGNPGLCGAPLPKCPRGQAPGVFPGLYISVVLGFIIGFWGVFGPLVIKRSWRHAYFRFLHNIHDKFYEIVIVIATKTWRKP